MLRVAHYLHNCRCSSLSLSMHCNTSLSNFLTQTKCHLFPINDKVHEERMSESMQYMSFPDYKDADVTTRTDNVLLHRAQASVQNIREDTIRMSQEINPQLFKHKRLQKFLMCCMKKPRNLFIVMNLQNLSNQPGHQLGHQLSHQLGHLGDSRNPKFQYFLSHQLMNSLPPETSAKVLVQ